MPMMGDIKEVIVEDPFVPVDEMLYLGDIPDPPSTCPRHLGRQICPLELIMSFIDNTRCSQCLGYYGVCDLPPLEHVSLGYTYSW